MNKDAVFTGDLNFMSLPDVFQIFGGNRVTGTLELTNPCVSAPGLIYFVDGDPVNAAQGALSGLDALYAMFGWVGGSLEFRAGEVNVRRSIKNSRMEIVLDALRLLDDGHIDRVGLSVGEDKGRFLSLRATGGVIRGPLIDYMHVIDEERFSKGERIVTEGGHGNWMWVILDGKVEVARHTAKGRLTIAHVGEGCFIGRLSSLTIRQPVRHASVTALGNVQLGVLDSQRLACEYSALSPTFKDYLLSMDKRLARATNTAASVFVENQPPDILPPNPNIVINEGDSFEGLCRIVEGEAHVVRQTSAGPMSLLTLKKDELFGHAPIVDLGLEPQSASIWGEQDLKVESVDAEGFYDDYARISATLKNIIENTITYICATSRLACDMQADHGRTKDEKETPLCDDAT